MTKVKVAFCNFANEIKKITAVVGFIREWAKMVHK
jgi:hypothetical protein